MVHRAGGNVTAFTVPSAAICLPVESITLLAHRTVSGVSGDGAIAVLIAVMGTNEAKAFGTKRIVGSKLQSTRKIAAEYAKARRDGFDSPDAEGIAERGGKMMRMASIIGNPYV